MKLLSMPYPSLPQLFKRAALDLKGTIVIETWGLSGQSVQDFTLYSVTLGTAFLLFKSYQVCDNKADLFLCLEIVKVRDVTFMCGRAGVCALGAVAAMHANDETLKNYYLKQFGEVQLSGKHPDELFYGKSGFLWACFFLNNLMGMQDSNVVLETLCSVRLQMKLSIMGGNWQSKEDPINDEWYGERYWEAAHGLAGIIYVLMDMDLKPNESEDVKGTLRYMINNHLPSGNFPTSEEDRRRDVLVHWCHGAPRIAPTLVKAAKKRGLLKRVGICHGISGNAYVFLSLYQMTGNREFLYKAKAFACFLLHRAHKLTAAGEMHGGDTPYSMFEGKGGMASLFLDMADPSKARFPAYDL